MTGRGRKDHATERSSSIWNGARYVDVLPDRGGVHDEARSGAILGVEYIARDRDGGPRRGCAARSAGRPGRSRTDSTFFKNLRMGIEHELSRRARAKEAAEFGSARGPPPRGSEKCHAIRVREPESRQRIRIAGKPCAANFTSVSANCSIQGYNISEIARELGISRRMVDHWVRFLDEPPVRRTTASESRIGARTSRLSPNALERGLPPRR